MARLSVESQLAKLRKAKEDIIKKEKALLDRTQGKVIARIVQLAADNAVSAVQIIEALKAAKKQKTKRASAAPQKSRGKVPAKYRNPDNPNETWTGRGRAPLWAKVLKDAGTLDIAHIPRAA